MTVIDWMFEHPYLTTICVISLACGWSPLIYVERDRRKEGKESDGK